MNAMAIATPVWKSELSREEHAFLQMTEKSNPNIQRVLCAPRGLDTSGIEKRFPDWEVRRFPDEAFTSVVAYSLWLTEPEFYRAFDDVEFVTICQLDAVLIKPISQLDLTETDYVGAPWVPPLKVLTPGRRIYVASNAGQSEGHVLTKILGRTLRVGNGGLSIRRVDSHIRVTDWIDRNVPLRYRRSTLEDVLLAAFGPRQGLRVASPEFAERVFMETGAQGLSQIPAIYGFHGLWRWNPELAALLLERET